MQRNILRLSFVILLGVVFLFASAGHASAATTYYVATTGNDSNPGTQGSPFASIQAAANVVNPGDTVIVKDGTYVSAYVPGWEVIVRVTRGGTAGNYVTFKSENPLGAKLDGQNNAAFAGFYLEAGYIRIEGFDISGVLNHGIAAYASHVQVVGNHIHDIGRVCVWSPSLGLARVGVSAGNITDLTVENNTFNDIGRLAAGEGSPPCTPGPYMQQDHGLYLSSIDNVTIKNNIFYNLFRGYPIHFYDGGSSPTVSTNIKILNNTMSGTAFPAGSGHIMLAMPGVSNAVIENNISYAPKNGSQIVYYLQPGVLSNVVARNNITYQGVISASSPPAGITFSGNLDNTNPNFVNAGAYNFRLLAGSPAINAGLMESAVTTDFAGVTRPQGGAYDIGAYEYASTGGGAVNLALNKPAVASSYEDPTLYPASAAFDGNATTRWASAFSDPQWMYVDLGANYAVNGVKLVWEAAYATSFKIQASTDAVTWVDIYTTTTGPGGTQNLTVTPTTARYIRMYGTLRATQYGYSLYEMEVYGSVFTPPVISAITAIPTSSSATVSWTTDEAADTQVEYGLTTSYGSQSSLNTSLLTSHSVALSGLSSGTLYHYRVKSKDAEGNLATSPDAILVTTPPVISIVVASSITASGATITWTTDLATDSQVEYGTTTSYGLQSTLNTARVTSHSMVLTGLSPSTLYHYRAKSKDASGTLAISSDATFTTAATPDTTPPVISSISATPTATGATLTWFTDELSDSQVEYGTTTSYGSQSTLNTSLVASHSVTLSGLSSGTLYHYRVKSKDALGNLATSSDATLTTSDTTPVVDTTAPVISNITASGGATNTTVTWNTNELSDSKVLYSTSSSSLLNQAVSSNLATNHSLVINNLRRKTTYYYQVVSKDAASHTASSTTGSFKTGNGKTSPITNLQAAHGSVILTWAVPQDDFVTKVVIYRSATDYPDAMNASDLLATVTDLTQTTYRDTAVSYGTTYYYSVFAVDDDGIVSDPTHISFTPQASTPPISSVDTSSHSSGSSSGGKKETRVTGKIIYKQGERTAPYITLVAPRVGTSATPSLFIQARATDQSGIQAIKVTVNGTLKKRVKTNSLSYTTKKIKGTTTINVTAYDTLGNAKTAAITVSGGKIVKVRYY